MIFKTEYFLIPENYVRMVMKTTEFDRYLREMFDDFDTVIIYEYNGSRIILIDENTAVEEKVE